MPIACVLVELLAFKFMPRMSDFDEPRRILITPLLGVASIVKWWTLASLDHFHSEKKTTWIIHKLQM